MKIKIEELALKFRFRDDIDFPATMTLLIGQFEVRGFSIRKSKFPTADKKHALFPPAKSLGGAKWLHLFHAPEKKEWQALEDRALQEFNNEHDKHLLEQIKEEDKIDNITF